MKRIIAALMCFFLCVMPLPARAAEPIGPPLEEITMFDTFYLETLTGGKLYSGMFLSLGEYERYVSVEKDLKIAEDKLEIFQKSDAKYDTLLTKWTDFADDTTKDLKKVKEMLEPSLWDEIKFEVGVGTGAVLVILVFFLVK